MKDKICTKNLNLYYGTNHALKDIGMNIKENAITAFIGPSGCGKSTFLRTLNRMNDLVPEVSITGEVILDGENIYDPRVDTTLLRKKIGMVFQQPENIISVLKQDRLGLVAAEGRLAGQRLINRPLVAQRTV